MVASIKRDCRANYRIRVGLLDMAEFDKVRNGTRFWSRLGPNFPAVLNVLTSRVERR
jgi:hypothetical protein